MSRSWRFRETGVGGTRASSVWLTGVWLLAGACGPGVATPMPEPPAAVFDLDGLNKGALPATLPEVKGEGRYVGGGAGTVPPGATVRIINLDQTRMVFADTAANDGSFLTVVVAAAGDELRFEWVKDGMRSAPADARVIDTDPSGMVLLVAPVSRFDCVQLEPGYVIDFTSDGARTLKLRNECAESLSIENPRARLGLADFELPEGLPRAVAPGESSELPFELTRGAPGLREDVAFVDVRKGTELVRYPITLRAE